MQLELRNITKHFPVRGMFGATKGVVRALEDINLSIPQGETVALVGESGSGKTTIAKMVLMLERPTSGSILWNGKDIAAMDRSGLHAYRREVQAVFQDPYSSLNPRMKVGSIVAEPIKAHRQLSGAALTKRVVEVLEIVGLPRNAATLYPHEFSGGQRQRIAIARALSLKPKTMVLDEPTSALDVSIRAQIVNLLLDIQKEFNLTYLLIAHDLALVEHFATQIGVIYLGKVVESGTTEAVFSRPMHPYTQTLLAAVPRADPDYEVPESLAIGEIGSAMNLPTGCRFNPRCPHAADVCRTVAPPFKEPEPGHFALCHFAGQIAPPAVLGVPHRQPEQRF